MKDHLIRATVPGMRGFAAVTTELAEEARRRHEAFPIAAAALGRTMTAACLLAANLKTDESVTIRIAGDGPIGQIIADAHPDGSVRGYVTDPFVDLPLREGKLDVGGAVGSGHIHVTRFTGMKQPFTGTTELATGEIAEDVTKYLFESEQTPSSVALGVLVNPDTEVVASGGFLIQALPDAEDQVISQVEQNLSKLAPVSRMVEQGDSAYDILAKVFAGLPLTVYDERKGLFFQCPCSAERVEKVLISLGAQEISELIREGKAEVKCHFCGEYYRFNQDELSDLLARAGASSEEMK